VLGQKQINFFIGLKIVFYFFLRQFLLRIFRIFTINHQVLNETSKVVLLKEKLIFYASM
jgi:hypothetical protein